MLMHSASADPCWTAQVLKVNKAGEAVLALTGDEDKLQAASQLIIGAAAIYDGSATSITASQVDASSHTLHLCSPVSCCYTLLMWALPVQLLLLILRKLNSGFGSGK